MWGAGGQCRRGDRLSLVGTAGVQPIGVSCFLGSDTSVTWDAAGSTALLVCLAFYTYSDQESNRFTFSGVSSCLYTCGLYRHLKASPPSITLTATMTHLTLVHGVQPPASASHGQSGPEKLPGFPSASWALGSGDCTGHTVVGQRIKLYCPAGPRISGGSHARYCC